MRTAVEGRPVSAGRRRPAVVVSRVHMEQIGAHLVGKDAQEVAGGVVQTKKIDDVEVN